MINKKIKEKLIIEMHRAIDESSTEALKQIKTKKFDLTYPPGETLTKEEKKAIKELHLNESLEAGLKKILSDTCYYPIFHLLSLLDGVVDPENIEEWFGATLTDKADEDNVMLHDLFLEKYWNYKNKKDS